MKEVFAGVDLGGTTIKVALGADPEHLLVEESIPTDSQAGPDAVLQRICDLIEDLSSRANVTIRSLGMAVPGLVDIERGITLFLPNLRTQWRQIPVADIVSQRLHCPVRLLNDVRTATLAELRFGHGRGVPEITMIFFSLGTGIGGGVVVDGKLRLGSLGAAGELGHQTVVPGGHRCGCGNVGCLETVASGPAIAAEGVRLMRMGLAPRLHEIVGGNADLVTPLHMRKAAEAGDERIEMSIVEAAELIGMAAANAVSILHPDLVVLGGGVAELDDLLWSTVKQSIVSRVGMFPADDVEVRKSHLGEKAGVVGALALASEI